MKQHKKGLALWLAAILLLLAGALLTGSPGRTETVQEAMRDAVLHDVNRISLPGFKAVNPGMISALLVTAVLLLAAALIRIFVIPKFRYMPGKFQMLLEEDENIFAYTRTDACSQLLVICNFYGSTVEVDLEELESAGELLIGNYKDRKQRRVLGPYEGRMYWRELG